MSHNKIRWGIIGTGHIAKKFAEGLLSLPEAELVAVGSRSQASADDFAAWYGIPHRHATYAGLANDSDVDAVYVATPHPLHKDNSLLCLEAGKAVLCEKPFALNAAQAEEVVKLARAKKLFLMEAMWTRFLPVHVEVRELLAEDAIGDVRMLSADFGFRTEWNPKGRLLNPELGGGTLLDVGIYPLSLASAVFGIPTRVTGLAHVGATGVDEQVGIVLGYGQGQLAILSAAVRTDSPQEARLMGSEGSIRIHSPWWKPTALTISRAGQDDEVVDLPYSSNGYNYEAAEVMACLRAGKLESDIMPLDETLAIMKTMDQLRAQWGLKYPME
jgi:predicted dehydrogenase